MRPLFMQFRRTEIDMATALSVIFVVTMGFVALGQTLGQATDYTVLELSVAAVGDQVPYRVNNLGDIAGRSRNPLSIGIQATIWSHESLQPAQLATLSGGDYSSAFDIN